MPAELGVVHKSIIIELTSSPSNEQSPLSGLDVLQREIHKGLSSHLGIFAFRRRRSVGQH
jgi:hypothetical protein